MNKPSAHAEREGAEPVAWRLRAKTGGAWTCSASPIFKEQWPSEFYEIEPLYSHPSLAPDSQADGLAEELDAFQFETWDVSREALFRLSSLHARCAAALRSHQAPVGEDVLPCELVIGGGHFHAGVKISTVQGAIDRMYARLCKLEDFPDD